MYIYPTASIWCGEIHGPQRTTEDDNKSMLYCILFWSWTSQFAWTYIPTIMSGVDEEVEWRQVMATWSKQTRLEILKYKPINNVARSLFTGPPRRVRVNCQSQKQRLANAPTPYSLPTSVPPAHELSDRTDELVGAMLKEINCVFLKHMWTVTTVHLCI
jgi:hypothetical protein